MTLKLRSITRSDRKGKKMKAVFDVTADGKTKTRTIHFGATGYEDYTQHHDKERRASYRKRHAKDPISRPDSAGSLAYWILWGESTSMSENIKAFRKKFSV